MSNHNLKPTANTRVAILTGDECLHFYANNLTRKNKTRQELRKIILHQYRKSRDVGFPIQSLHSWYQWKGASRSTNAGRTAAVVTNLPIHSKESDPGHD